MIIDPVPVRRKCIWNDYIFINFYKYIILAEATSFIGYHCQSIQEVIGQDCFEQDDSLVAPFVKDMAAKMTYRVALDDKSSDQKDKTGPKGKMAESWMTLISSF